LATALAGRMRAPTGRAVGLTTRGRCLLAGGAATAVCAVILDERDLLRVGAFVALLPVLALLLVVHTRRAVRAERTLRPARLAVDGAVTGELRLRGGALLGVLRLADTVPDAAGPAADAPPRFVVQRVPRGSGLRLRYALRPVLRGVHRIGPLRGQVTDPLGLAEFSRELVEAHRLVVLPRVVPLHGLPSAFGAGEGTSGAALAHQGKGISDVVVRPYRHGDELRRVHWRSTARHDELMVRLEERPWRGGTTVLLDRRDAAHRGHGASSSLEFAVSLAASICVHLIDTLHRQHGDPVTLVTEDGAELTGPGAAGGRDTLLDALAALRPSAQRDLAGPQLHPSTDLFAVLGALGPGDLEGLLARRSTGGHAVLVDPAGWDAAGWDAARSDAGGSGTGHRDGAGRGPAGRDPAAAPERTPDTVAGQAAALRRAGWRVAIIRAGATPETVWADLLYATASDRPRPAR
jgi:uncharacterized protein (DUF58 family)